MPTPVTPFRTCKLPVCQSIMSKTSYKDVKRIDYMKYGDFAILIFLGLNVLALGKKKKYKKYAY